MRIQIKQVLLFLSIGLVGCGNSRTEHGDTPTDSTSDTTVTCLIHDGGSLNPRCDVDTFTHENHTCVRWHNGYGSDMDCWPTPSNTTINEVK